MRNFCVALIAGAAIAAGSSMAAKPQVAAKAASPRLLQLDFKATVQADGTLTDIQPDASLPQTIQAMIRKRVATWRYKTAHWQGKSQPTPIAQTITAVAVPTEQGGFALRIEEVTGQNPYGAASKELFASRPPPEYPTYLRKRGVSAILAYGVLYDEAGKPVQVDLVYSSGRDRDTKHFDDSARKAISKWEHTHEFAGSPISCRANVTITFEVGDAGGFPAPLRAPPEVAAMFDKYSDMCPMTILETPVKDTAI